MKLGQKIDALLKIGGFAVTAGTAIGAGLLFLYCSHISFYPAGLSLGDTLLFVFFSAGFIIVYGILFYLLFAMGYLLTPVARGLQLLLDRCKVPKVRHILGKLPRVGVLTWSDLGTVIAGLLIALYMPIIWSKDANFGLGLITSSVGVYFWWLVVVANPMAMPVSKDETAPEGSSESSGWAFKYKKPLVWIMFLSIPLISFNGLVGPTLDATARFVGVRQDHVSVLLPKTHLELSNFFQRSVDLSGRLVLLPDGGIILKDIDILFQGIGSKTLVAIGTPNGGFKVPFPSQDVLPLIPLPSAFKGSRTKW